ncbi:hypothetical protein ACX0HA_09840 [Flavobacterium hauense]
MKALKIKITKFIDAHQPGFVECTFIDAWNKKHIIHEKVPVVTTENLDTNSIYPVEGIVNCEIIKEYTDSNNRIIVTISTEKPWDISTIEDMNVFDILENQLTESY